MTEKKEWMNRDVLRLIEAFKERPCLWDHNDKDFKLLKKKNECWAEIANIFDVDVYELRKKMNSVLASYRRERQKHGTLKPDGDRYFSNWFAYNSMKFIKRKRPEHKCKRTEEAVSTSNNFNYSTCDLVAS